MTFLSLLFATLPLAPAEFSNWCADAAAYQVRVLDRTFEVRVGDGGRVCDENVPVNQRPVTRFSANGGLTNVASYYAFFGGRVRLVLRHLKLRCSARRECQPLRAGERCGILNQEGNVWPGAEAAWPADAAPERRLAFDRVAWNALLGVARARELLGDEAKWQAFGLSAEERAALAEDLRFSRRHCDAAEADPRANVLEAGRIGVLEEERLAPVAEFYDHRWQVSETTFHSLYRRFDAGAREVWALRTPATTPYAASWLSFDGHAAKPRTLDLALPFLITSDEVVERRGFFAGAPAQPQPRVISSLAGTKDPENWRTEKPSRLLQRTAREAFRRDHPRRFECLPRADEGDNEILREVPEPFADAELDVYRAFVARNGEQLVAVRVAERCRQPMISETSLAPVLQRHWYFVPKGGSPRLVTRAKEAWLAVDFDQDGSSEWLFTSAGVDERPPYYYALFARPRGEVIESH